MHATKNYRARPSDERSGRYGALVGLADALCQSQGIWSPPSDLNLGAHPALEYLGLGLARMPNASQIHDHAQKIKSFAEAC